MWAALPAYEVNPKEGSDELIAAPIGCCMILSQFQSTFRSEGKQLLTPSLVNEIKTSRSSMC
jgi:hypothetical protein